MENVGDNKETHDIMENSVYTPSEVLERIMQAGKKEYSCLLYVVFYWECWQEDLSPLVQQPASAGFLQRNLSLQ